jgi:hypothetical protein
LDSLIQSNHSTFAIGKDSLTGPSVSILKKEFRNTQFVLIGENHNTAEIPDFTTKLFSILNKDLGFKYVALEQDPITMRHISMDGRGRDLSYLKDKLTKYPNAFTFNSDQEIEMLSSIINISKNKNAVWGCDQAFGVANAIEDLRLFKRSKEIDSLYSFALRYDSIRSSANHFIAQDNNRKFLADIQNRYADIKDEHAQFIIYSLLKSNSIYSKFLNKNKYESRFEREQYMKERFTEEYNQELKGHSLPKVLLKFGNAHLIYGFNEGSNVISLGTFVSELSKFNGQKTVSLNTLILRKDGSNWDLSNYPTAKHLLLFTKHCDTTTSHLIDLRPIRPFFYRGALNKEIQDELKADFEKLIFGFDFLVFIGNGRTAGFTIRNRD